MPKLPMLRAWPLVLAIAAAIAPAQAPQPSAESVAKQIEAELEAADVPGAAIAVVSGEETLARGFGFAGPDGLQRVDSHTLFQIGSLTKLLTAIAVVRTLENRNLSLDAAVGAHVDGLSARAAKLTFRQLLSHSAGLSDRAGGAGTSDEPALLTAARALDDAAFVLPAGTVFSYSNHGYTLAGAALERIAQKPYADVMREVVFAPLGMLRTTLRPADAMARTHALGHRLVNGALEPAEPPANDTRIWPAGYAWSSAADVVRIVSVLVNAGRVYTKPVLPVSTLGMLTAPSAAMPNVFPGGHYGLGLMVARIGNGPVFYEHGGTMPGYSAILRITPGRRLGVAILTNLDNAPLRRIAQTAMSSALGVTETPLARTDTPVTAQELRPLLGIYRNRGTAELAERDGNVVLILDGGPPMLVSRIGANRYLARPKPDVAGPEFVLEPARGPVPAYLHLALWAYVSGPDGGR